MPALESIQYHGERAVTVNQITIVYDSFGDPSDPAMLLLMGLGQQMIAWNEELCRMLAAKGYWVIRFDQRDVGLSAKFNEAGIPNLLALIQGEELEVPYTLDDMAKDATGLLSALQVDSAHLVGASMGGMVAQMIAINYPERVRTMTSIMSATGYPTDPPPKPEAELLLFSPSPEERSAYIEHNLNSWRILSGQFFDFNENHWRKYLGQVYDRGRNPAGFSRQLAAIIASGSRKEALRGVRIPTLVIHGDADPLVPVESGYDTADTIPGAQLMIIEGMGHSLPPETWQQIVEAIAKLAQRSWTGNVRLEHTFGD